MKFSEIVQQAVQLLQTRRRVTYRVLKREFDLDDDSLKDLKEQLIDAERVAMDEDGKVLVWVGEQPIVSVQSSVVSSPQSPAPTPQPPAAERRQLTVLFCDLVGSTALSTQLDPEDLRAVVQHYQQTCAEIIQRHEGHIAQYLGDGLLVYFGYPTAHEDDARQAVRTGLEILTVLRSQVPSPFQGEGQGESNEATRSSETPHPTFLPKGARELKARIGIHTGLVVIGDIGASGRTEQLALGETPNLAARIQGLAEPNTVMISAATQRLVEGQFESQPFGSHLVKGVDTPIAVYHVHSEQQGTAPLAWRSTLTPLVGREEELALLQRRWEQVKDREGQVALLSGEPGIGKSRLVQELRTRVAQDGAVCIEFRCSPYHQNSALQPIIEHLQHLLPWHKDDTPLTKLDKLQTTLTRYRFSQADTLALFAALLSLPHPADTVPLHLSPQRLKQKTEEALIAWLLEEAERAPLYCAWEDLHWADPSTLELLGRLIDRTPTARLLVLLTSRPEFTPPWGQHSHFSQLTLSRLGRRQVPQMIEKATGGKSLPTEVLQQIIAKTDGVPLFVEELTKMVLESGLLAEATDHYELIGPLPPLAIPATLQDSLMARLDRLASVRELAQLGATIGREFAYELLQAVSPLDSQTLQNGLQQLVATELVYQRGTPPQATYLFKHALIQDTAYQSLLKSRRQQLHRQIAQVLEEQFPDTKDTQPELLAHHYTEAGLIEQAIPYWSEAGQKASQRFANAEAVHHLTRGLEQLKTIADSHARAQQELVLQLTLGNVLLTTQGYTAPEVVRTYTRARELCRQVGDTPHLFPVLWGAWSGSLLKAELPQARELAEQLLQLAERAHDAALLLEAHYALGDTLFWLGEFTLSRTHLAQTIRLYNPQQHRSQAVLYGQEERGVTSLSYISWTLWHLGYDDQALVASREALTLADQLAPPFSQAFALGFAAWLHLFRRERDLTRTQAKATIDLSIEQGFPFWLALATISHGWAQTAQEQGEDGIVQMRRGLIDLQAGGTELGRPLFLAYLAEACATAGQVGEGLTVLGEALAQVDRTGERSSEAELYRLKGELTLAQSQASLEQVKTSQDKPEDTDPRPLPPDPQGEAEACFHKSIAIAQKQHAKSLELRAVISLARLWQQQGKSAEAHRMLSEIYGWFTEGFETKDLREAKALLEELC